MHVHATSIDSQHTDTQTDRVCFIKDRPLSYLVSADGVAHSVIYYHYYMFCHLSDNVQHDLQHGSLITFPKENLGNKRKLMHQVYLPILYKTKAKEVRSSSPARKLYFLHSPPP